jgi:hypothetical protein
MKQKEYKQSDDDVSIISDNPENASELCHIL